MRDLTVSGEFERAFPAHIAHHIPGRLRFQVPDLKGKPQQLAPIAQSLRKAPEVLMCETNPLTGSILVHYRPTAYDWFVSMLTEFAREKALFHLPGDPSAITNRNRLRAGPEQASGLSRLRQLTGSFLLWVGVAGVLLPLVPGTPFLLAGLALLGTDQTAIERVRRWTQWIRGVRLRAPESL